MFIYAIIILFIYLSMLFNHWLADFCFQTEAQATNKSKSNKYLAQHVLTYSLWNTMTSALIYFMLNIFTITIVHFLVVIVFIFIFLFSIHFVIDYFTSRLNTKLWEAKRVHDFFVSVGADQYYHQIHLAILLLLLLAI